MKGAFYQIRRGRKTGQSIDARFLDQENEKRALNLDLSPQKKKQVTSEDEFNSVLASADVVLIDFMARWCRKCIYIKPRVATLLKEKFPQVPLAFVDVNAVPSSVVSGAGVTKMPTIVLYVRGKIAESYVAGESATTAVLMVEEMVKKALAESKKAAKA